MSVPASHASCPAVWRLARVQDLAILSERVCMHYIRSSSVCRCKNTQRVFFLFFLKRDDCSEISTAFQLCGIRTYVQSTASAQ